MLTFNAESLRVAHRAKTEFDMDAFLIWVAKQLEDKYMEWVEIHPMESRDDDWFKSPGFRDRHNSRITIAPAYTNRVLTELLVQGYNIYSQKGGTFAVTLYQYPSNHFGGTIIYQADKTFKY